MPRIIVADDQDQQRRYMLSVLKQIPGCENAYGARDGNEVLAKLDEWGGLDLLITDNNMPPGMDGTQLIA